MNYSAIDYNQLYSPQMSATTMGNRPYYIPIEEIIRGRAETLPELYEIQRAKQIQEEQQRLEQETLGIQQNQARLATGIEAANLGIQAYSSPTVRKAAISGWKNFGFHPTAQQTTSSLASSITPDLAIPGSEMVGGEVGKQVGRSALGTLSSLAGPAGWGSLAGNLAQTIIPGKQRYKTMGGVASGALAGTYIMPGIGTAIGAIFGGISASTKKCIIVTTCTSPNSYGVQIAREYRDKFLNSVTLRGYYMLADRLVPQIENSIQLKHRIREILVDKLIDYAEVELGKKDKLQYKDSEQVTKEFISVCNYLGNLTPTYTRLNGEAF